MEGGVMKEIVILSGKGGTGKTSLVAAFSSLLKNKVMADCDVDAANLNIILGSTIKETREFSGGHKAEIIADVCTACGKCREVCRYNAISENFVVDPLSCEGCGACYFLCPAKAVSFPEALSGHYFVAETDNGDGVVFAELLPGAENSGKLVSMVRSIARELAAEHTNELVFIDGPPGIGCPVISSITGTQFTIFVTEPTVTGIHDLERVMSLAQHFKVPAAVVVNKADINPDYTDKIMGLCQERGITFLGSIPYEPMITAAQRQGKTILETAPESTAGLKIREIFSNLTNILEAL
jgi:MinD superfamily P-loop ATPase